jgi:tetratricopeptide (TPR) repeat protein
MVFDVNDQRFTSHVGRQTISDCDIGNASQVTDVLGLECSIAFILPLYYTGSDISTQGGEGAMKQACLFLGLVLFTTSGFMGCDSSQTGGGTKKAGTAADSPLSAPASSAARMQNDEGVGHYQQGHWDVAMEHFQKAVKADPNSAVVHYNVALTLDKMGKHEDATKSFKKALELAPTDPVIKDSEILKKHVSM